MSISQQLPLEHVSNNIITLEVILNGDSSPPTRLVDGVIQIISSTIAEQRLAKKNELKTRGTLLMALPNKHQLKFNIHKDAKSFMEAIEKRFSVSAVLSVSVASSKATVSTLLNVDSLSDAVIYSFFANLKWQMAMLTMRARRFLKRTGRNLGANGTDTIEFDMFKVKCYNCHRRGHSAREYRSPRDNRNKEATRRPVSIKTDEEPTNYALMAYASSGSSRSSGYGNETSYKNLSKLLESQVSDKTGLGFDSQVFNGQVFDCEELHSYESDSSMPKSPENDRYKTGKGYHVVPPLYTGTFIPSKPDLVFNDDPNASELVANVFNVESNINKPSNDMSNTHRSDASIIKDWISDSKDETKIESMPKQKEPSFVPTSEHVKNPRESVKKVEHRNPQQALKDKGVIDGGCSRHMTRNISFLSDFEEINGGYVAFGGNPKGGKILGKGKIKTGKLDFDDVYFVKELKFNLFSLPDENHVFLRVPRENNMYNVDLKNVVPLGDLTCLFAKDTLDESNLWHKRLGHINFKTMNKLIKDSLLPIPFWAKAVNVACCVQNRVLVTKPHNKTPYELLLGRSPSIGFMRPFDGKADEGFLVRYSINSNAFRVFNSRIRIVQETLHINFLENKPNVAGIRPKWLFDIDTLTKSINYQLVIAGNQPNDNAGIQENLDAGEVEKETVSTQQYVLLPLWSTGSQVPQNTDDDVTDASFDVKENKNDVYAYANGSDKYDNKKHDEKTKRDDKGKSLVDLPTRVRDLRAKFEEFSSNITNMVNVVSAPVNASSLNSTNSTNNFNTANMPELEEIIYSDDEEDVGAKADFSNLETNIPISYILTTRVNKDHPVNQIIGDLNLAPQTRSMTKMVKEQGFEDPDYLDKVYKVVKALYGLHQAPRAWSMWMTLSLDLPKELCKAYEILMNDKLQMSSMGELTFFLGITTSTPIETEKPLLKDPDSEDVDVHIYRSMIGSLMYLTSFRTDIMFAICACARFQVTPKASHLHAVKRIFSKELASLKQTALGKDISNLFMAGSLPKTICKELASLKQTALGKTTTGKETSNLFMADSLPITILLTMLAVKLLLFMDDADGVECLPNKEIFEALARMGYEKPPLKLAFYKAFFSAQWKFLIYTLLQCLSAKRTAWNKFSCSMASVVTCLATVVMNNQVDDMSSHTTRYTSPVLTQKVFANMRRVGKVFSGVETPLFASMLDPIPTSHATPSQDQPSTPPASPPQEQPTTTFESSMSLLTTLIETCVLGDRL
uniref:Uncharacterized protein n=1 Tax=Tanacetum cinerariifolium TaxID=118510 RepID=A0A6L2KST4_TANCI|nr:hypothetical protein [Tanacetum cinerariifolium]